MTTHTATQALFAWPPQAAVGRPVAKSKIYAHGKPSAALRALFVEQVESITWAYKLAPETINLPAKLDVPEIEVFEIALKLPDVSHSVLRCIDKAIPFPILFVLRFEGHSQPVAAYKRPSDAAHHQGGQVSQWVVGDYHAAPWQKEGVALPGLPVALDLQGLYEQLLRQHFAAPARAGESLRAGPTYGASCLLPTTAVAHPKQKLDNQLFEECRRRSLHCGDQIGGNGCANFLALPPVD